MSYVATRGVSRARTRFDTTGLARVAFLAFAVREPFSGAVQWLLDSVGLSPMWFVPDVLAAICLTALVFEDAFLFASGFYIILILYLIASMTLGWAVSDSLASVASGFKAVLPIFVGVLIAREVTTRGVMQKALYILLMLAIVGVPFSIIYPLPWAQLSFDAGLGSRQFQATVWGSGGSFRPFGFASDMHGAGVSIMMLWILLGLNRRSGIYYLTGIAALVAVFLTTSRTGFAVFSLLFALRYAFDRMGGDIRRGCLSAAAIIPWAACCLPFAIIAFGTLVPRSETGPLLDSVWIRGNQVFLAPFEFMSGFFSLAWAFGFGLGGIGFPLMKSDYAAYASIIDNFDLWGYYTFGIPFLFMIVYVVSRASQQADVDRRFVFCALALFGQFILGWPTPPFMILLGYAVAPLMREGLSLPPPGRQQVS